MVKEKFKRWWPESVDNVHVHVPNYNSLERGKLCQVSKGQLRSVQISARLTRQCDSSYERTL